MKDLDRVSMDAQEPASPCVRICALDASGYCIGCERHIDEVVAWPRLSVQRKREVLDQLPARRERRQGRA
jgi:uncharacterized protein